MQIILAVDILKGKVVKAFAGLRINYKPLFIGNKDFSDAICLINEVKKKIFLKKVYIADLDSIGKIGTNNKYIERILKCFPDITFLIDAGFDYPISVHNFHKRKEDAKLSNYEIVLGTETLRNFQLPSLNQSKKFQLSIDFNGEQNIWIKKIIKQKIYCSIILMFLDRVGGRGLNLDLIKRLTSLFCYNTISVAGGINTDGQISQLSRIGVKSVLSSSLIHKKISRDEL